MPAIKLYNRWELVSTDVDAAIETHRLRVQGGWVIHVNNTDLGLIDTCFTPDPQHEWEPVDETDPD